MLAHPTWPEKLPRFMLRCISGSVRYNAEIAAEYPEILLYTANIGGKLTRMNTKCPLCVAAGVRRPGEDTKNHLFRECPQTQAERVSLKQAIEAAVDETTDSNISRGGARAVATAVMARPDYYAGQIDQEVKITIDKDRKNSAQGCWKDDQGQPFQIKHGLIQKEVISSSHRLHNRRMAVLDRFQVEAGDQPTAHHGLHFIRLAINDYNVKKILKKGIQVTQIIPGRSPHPQGAGTSGHLVVISPGAPNTRTTHPPKAAGSRAAGKKATRNPQAPTGSEDDDGFSIGPTLITNPDDGFSIGPTLITNPDDGFSIGPTLITNPAGDFAALLATLRLIPVGVTGDGNCLPYAVLRSAGRMVNWEAAITLRTAAVNHALLLTPEVQEDLLLRRSEDHPNDPMGNILNHNDRRNIWPIAAQARYGQPYFANGQAAWMHDNMLHSIATIIGMDVVLLKRIANGQVCEFIAVYHADLPPPVVRIPLYSIAGWTAGPLGRKTLAELITASRNGGRRVCVISCDASKTHFEATCEIPVQET